MRRADRLVRRQLRTRFLVTTVDEETFDGVLLEADDLTLVLADAAQVATSGDRLPVDGHLWLPRLTVKYLQQLTP